MRKGFSPKLSLRPPDILPAWTLRDNGLKQLWAAWNLLKGELPLPSHPADILRHLPATMSKLVLIDVEEGGSEFRFRLVGEAVFPGLQETQVSRSVREHPDKVLRFEYTSLLLATCAGFEPVRGVTRRDEEYGQVVETESLWLPFGSSVKVRQVISMSASSAEES